MTMTQRKPPVRAGIPDRNGHKQQDAQSWRWLCAPAFVVVVALAAYALFHFVILSHVPYAMLGKWLVVGGEMDGATVEFQRDGSMTGIVNMKGKEGKILAKVEVENDLLRITSVNPYTKQPETDVHTIRMLHDDQLVIEDRKGTVLKMERLRQ
jgi:hypothetical protein